MVLQQVNAIATESGEFRDRYAAEHLQVLDGMLPEITRDRIGEDAIPAVSELAGAAQANFKEIIGGYAQAIAVRKESLKVPFWICGDVVDHLRCCAWDDIVSVTVPSSGSGTKIQSRERSSCRPGRQLGAPRLPC